MYGWMGKILRVDLGSGDYRVEDLDPEIAKKFIGGQGIATKLLVDEMAPKTNPLGPKNKLIFATGPLTGTHSVTSSRYMVITKSPLTGAFSYANSGGFWGPELKFSGYDLIIIEGKSKKPVYLRIENDQIEIRPARHLWGKDTSETEDIIQEELRKEQTKVQKRARIASIGPAGEKLSRIAAIVNDKHRVAARMGLGAVMGSKNLKAIAVRGSGKVPLADPEGFKKTARSAWEKARISPVTGKTFPLYGTSGMVNFFHEAGLFPVRNFQENVFDDVAQISGETQREKFLVKNRACFSCPIGCGRVTRVLDLKFQDEGEGAEYESIGLLGGSCGVSNLAAVLKANYLCDRLGIDTISMGGTIACAMELFEKGLLTENEVGFKIGFGDAASLVRLVEMTGKREGFGDILAEGGYRLANKYKAPEVFMGIKKLEYPAYDPRAAFGMGLSMATAIPGASHGRGYTIAMEVIGIPKKLDPFEWKGKAMLAKSVQDLAEAWDASGLCVFAMNVPLGPDFLAEQLTQATGIGFIPPILMLSGERMWNLQKIFNIRAGIGQKNDTLPRRFIMEAPTKGPAKGKTVPLNKMLPEYYELRGWDEKGIPYPGKLSRLGLENYII